MLLHHQASALGTQPDSSLRSRSQFAGGRELELTIVPLSSESIPAVIEVHQEAFAGYMNTRLGRGYTKAFFGWFCRDKRNITLGALGGRGETLGYVVGAQSGWDRLMSRDLFWSAAVRVAFRPWLFLSAQFRQTAMRRLGGLIGRESRHLAQPVLPEPTMSLVGIGVASNARGLRCGTTLINAFEEKAKALGMRSMNLAVYPGNLPARRLYEKCGWQPFELPPTETIAMFYSKLLPTEKSGSRD